MTYTKKIAALLNITPQQAAAAVELLDEGNTVPFIARYRKEMTDSLDDEQVRQVADVVVRLRTLDQRRAVILASIESQGALDEALNHAIQAAETPSALEDLYLPYRPKRRTRATIAREKGLAPLAEMLLAQTTDQRPLTEIAASFTNQDVETVDEALQGASDIAAERISDNANIRAAVREKAIKFARLVVEKTPKSVDEKRIYENYYAFDWLVNRLQPHQVLAINRGEEEGVLRVRVEIEERDWLNAIQSEFRPRYNSPLKDLLASTIEDAAQRLLLPAIGRDVRRELTEKADSHAIQVFAQNLQALLGQPPLSGHTILGIDPAYRTGCKLAIIDPTGKLLETGTIYPHQPQNDRQGALETLRELVRKHNVSLIAIGNGTASRETEQLAADLTRQSDSIRYTITSEAGASVYSASALAREELPNLDVSLRGAVNIARRVQDPLAELVKIEPKSIGVGLYQHDVDQTSLSHALNGVVERVVNTVGVDANTASPALLTHVSGIGPKLAEAIFLHRQSLGPFKSRQELTGVPGLGEKTFQQSAGFLRINNGEDALDASAIHPESYPTALKLLSLAGSKPSASTEDKRKALDKLLSQSAISKLASQLGCGEPTLADILEQLIRPGRDPRQNAPAPILRSDILSMADLSPGMRLTGTVRNMVDFGAFIDIGVKQDGLLHRSQIPPNSGLKVGDVIEVVILKIEPDRGRIGLGTINE